MHNEKGDEPRTMAEREPGYACPLVRTVLPRDPPVTFERGCLRSARWWEMEAAVGVASVYRGGRAQWSRRGRGWMRDGGGGGVAVTARWPPNKCEQSREQSSPEFQQKEKQRTQTTDGDARGWCVRNYEGGLY